MSRTFEQHNPDGSVSIETLTDEQEQAIAEWVAREITTENAEREQRGQEPWVAIVPPGVLDSLESE